MTGNLDLLDNKKAFNEKNFFADGDWVNSKYIGEFKGYINDNKNFIKKCSFYYRIQKKFVVSKLF